PSFLPLSPPSPSPLSLHDALPIYSSQVPARALAPRRDVRSGDGARQRSLPGDGRQDPVRARGQDAGIRLMPTVAEHLAHRLHEAGVRHAFGIPGGEVLAVMDALARAGRAFHLVKHETALVDRAVLLATADPPGPVHLDIPVRVASMEAERARESLPRRARVGLAAGGELDTLVGWLGRAERPLVLAGLGILHHDAHAELRAFVRRAGAAVITTYKAKGVVAEDDPAVIGGAGLSPVADRALFKALHAADLILCLGYDPVEMRDSWIQPWPTQTDSAEIAGAPKDHLVHRTKLEFVADLKAA